MWVALVRHPAVIIAPGVCYGRLDLDLDGDAVRHIAQIRNTLADFPAGAVYTSPSRRCRVVAEALAERLAVVADARLQELDFGNWEGRPWDDVPRAALDEWARDPLGFAAPGGETGAALIARVRDFHGRICQAGQNCIVVSHGGPLRVLAGLLEGRAIDLLAPAPPLGSVRIFTARLPLSQSTPRIR
jgi:alpha-ribazole phosphatase